MFIPLVILFLNYIELKKKIFHIILFTSICLIFTLPYGLYNLKVNGVYVFSSNGFGGLFILGHNEDAYVNHIKTPKIGTDEAKRLKNVDYKIFDFFMLFERKTGFSTAVGGMWWATGPNNNGHTGWLSSMQKLGLDGLFAALNFIPAEMTRQVTPIVNDDEVVGSIDYDVDYIFLGAWNFKEEIFKKEI